MTRIAITGAAGTVGSRLAKKYSDSGSNSLVLIDRDENALRRVATSVEGSHVAVADSLSDPFAIASALEGVDAVIHCAASKHVGFGESNPLQAVRDNVLVTQNVLHACKIAHVRKLMFTSSDKSVGATTVMGATKMIAERLVLAAGVRGDLQTSVTRFGNVLGSQGSVVPLSRDRLRSGAPLLLTDRRMTRLVMTEQMAVEMVEFALLDESAGQLVVPQMSAIYVKHLILGLLLEHNAKLLGEVEIPQDDAAAESAFDLHAGSGHIVLTEPGPGEKLWEELLLPTEQAIASNDERFLYVYSSTDNHENDSAAAVSVNKQFNSDSAEKLSFQAVFQLLQQVEEM